MPIDDVASAAQALLDAERAVGARGRITEEWPGLDLPTSFEVQRTGVALRVAAGDRVVGAKLGLTSVAKQRQVGVDAPLTAVLLESYRLAPGEPVPTGRLIHPRVEPEIVVVLGADLAGPGATAADARAAIAEVRAGFEVIDSRFVDFSFAVPDVIADNASSACFAVSATAFPIAGLDLVAERVRLFHNGDLVAEASGEAIMGDPAEALAVAANDLATRGERFAAGSIVLTGGITQAVPVAPGDEVVAEFSTLGELRLAVV